MHIVIDIDNNLYTRLFDNGDIDAVDMLKAYVAIRNGTLLPKGHGRLIDADELKKIIKENDQLVMGGFSVCICDINNTPTIIKADKETKE